MAKHAAHTEQSTARRDDSHTWILSKVDPQQALTSTIRELRNAGATRAADTLSRRAGKNV